MNEDLLEEVGEEYNEKTVYHSPEDQHYYIQRECDQCEESYYARKNKLEKGKGNTCSSICGRQMVALNNLGIEV